jgi:hypothetical protein
MVHPVSFLVAELGPDVDPFTLHLFAALAEKERAARARQNVGHCHGKPPYAARF